MPVTVVSLPTQNAFGVGDVDVPDKERVKGACVGAKEWLMFSRC